MRESRVALLRGVNLGPARRVPMAELRRLLGEAGFEDVATYLQSGNIVVSSSLAPEALERELGELISARFGISVPVVIRSGSELAAVVERDPIPEAANDPKRYQVSFLSAALVDTVRAKLEAAAGESERIVFHGRELYAWHPEGVARSKLWKALAGSGLGVVATARNWKTVTELARMAAGGS